MGFEPVGYNTRALACMASYPGNDDTVMNFNEFKSFSAGHIIWQATAIIDG